MDKNYWKETVAPVVKDVLSDVRNYTNGEKCYITAYQIAAEVNKRDHKIKLSYATGGAGAGPATLAQRIAWYLSNDESFCGKGEIIERAFLSAKYLTGFLFEEDKKPSNNEFSMFRLLT